jgi:hypothetical protein
MVAAGKAVCVYSMAMSERAWRNLALALMVVVAILWWRDCHRPRAVEPGRARREAASARSESRSGFRAAGDTRARPARDTEQAWDESDEEAPPAGPDLRQQIAEHWAVRFLTPQPGETLLDYRDRVVPAAQLAVAPHRTRVAENRRRFAEAAALDDEQQRALDAAVQRAASDIQDHVMQSVLSGELMPPRVRPARAVAFARDVLDMLDRANREFRGTLSSEQLAVLDESGFDIVDYLVFSTRWEDLLGVVE